MARDRKNRRIPPDIKAVNEIPNYNPEAIFYDDEEMGIAFMIFASSAVVYVLTMYPDMASTDSGEISAVAKEFGVSRPPGHPLFALLASCVVNSVSSGSTVWKVNFMSAIIGSLTNVMLYLNVKRLSGNDSAGVVTAGWCGFSKLFWVWSIQGDVWSLNNLMTAILLYVSWRFVSAERHYGKCFEANILALIGGLALSNHQSSLLTVIPLLVWVISTLVIQSAFTLKSTVQIILWGLVGLSPYLQLPLSSFFFEPRITWGDHSSSQYNDFPGHVTSELSTMAGYVAGRMDSATLVDNAQRFFYGSCRDLTIVVWILFAVGLIAPCFVDVKKKMTIMCLYTTILIVHLIMFGCYTASANPSDLMLGLLERYWLQPSVIVVTVAGFGLGAVLSYLSALAGNNNIVKYSLVTLAVFTAAFQVQQNYTSCDESDNYYFHQYARHILPSLPKHSILLTYGDLPTNMFRYHTIGEEYRTDVMVMDMNFMKGRWFYTKLMPVNWPGVSFPGFYKPGNSSLYPFYNLRIFLDQNYDRFPVFVCRQLHPLEDSLEGVYEAWPYGGCLKIVRAAAEEDIFAHTEQTPQVRAAAEEDVFAHLEQTPQINLDVFRLPDPNRYGIKTWEFKIMSDMLKAMKQSSLWLTERANDDNRNVKYREKCFVKSLEILEGYRDKILEQIEKGELPANMVNYIASMEHMIGQHSLAVRHFRRGNKDEVVRLEEKALMHWTNYVEWQKDEIEGKVNDWEIIVEAVERGNLKGWRIL